MTISTDDEIASLHSLIAGIDTALLVTLDDHGCACSRPVSVITTADEADLWIVAPNASAMVAEVRARADVVLHFTRPSGSFVVVTGRGHVHHARGRGAVCTPDLDARLTGEHLALIHINVDRAEHWESPAAEPTVLQFVKPVATGRRRMADRGVLHLH